jgi:hypothetical protein
MTSLNTFLVLCFVSSMLGCASVTVHYDYDTEANFSNIKTFDWLPVLARADMNRLNVKRIKNAVNTQLEVKGLKATADKPDLLVAMSMGKQLEVTVTDHGYAHRPYRRGRWYGGGGGVSVNTSEKGTLVIDLVDAKTKELIWQGVAKGTLKPNQTQEKQEKRINEAVTKPFKHFPPDSN